MHTSEDIFYRLWSQVSKTLLYIQVFSELQFHSKKFEQEHKKK